MKNIPPAATTNTKPAINTLNVFVAVSGIGCPLGTFG